ncbi:secreted RxLR effector protein 161-like [Primulina tabacum]|uniref:secreted RxLR effector protein 161-like n=1 Tax=Primulina tabacum TaxID=48773 RepID=UPI003F5AC6E1
MEKIPYANAVGSLMYAMICTRPDLAYAVSLVSRYISKPGRNHWEAMKWIFRYLRGTLGVGLLYGKRKESTEVIEGHVDADYAGCLDSRRLLTCYVFKYHGNVVSWKCNLQQVVTLSTTEVEFIAVTEVIKEALWISGMVAELKPQETAIAKVYCDSQWDSPSQEPSLS